MTEAAEVFSLEKWWEKLIEKTPVKYISLILAAFGGAFLFWAPRDSFRHSLGEAAVIAALLVFLVDPFLKARLLKEASKDIFRYMLGFDQQPEIKQRLRELVFETKLFRRNFNLRCVFIPEGDKMRLDMDVSFEVFNPTAEVQKYTHATQFERVEYPESRVMSLISEAGNYSRNDVPFKPKEDDIEVLEAKAGHVNIEPSSKNISYRFSSGFSLLYPLEFFHAVHVGTPTIGMRIEVFPPEGFRVTASQTPTCTENIWQYDGLFMPGQHVDIRWERNST